MKYDSRYALVMYLGLFILAVVTTICAVVVFNLDTPMAALLGGALGFSSQMLARELLS